MSNLATLSPNKLWSIFEKICAIPHPSHHEEALAQHIIQVAQEKNIHCERDQVGNILLRKPATKGFEHLKSIALQAHLDMVPQKRDNVNHHFETDPIKPYIDGDWVKAQDTTLGADNGIGLASALAVMFDDTIEHGPLEVLLTMTEETGMEGAFGLQPNWLQSQWLINTDSEEEGEVYMGCAGGINVNMQLPISFTPSPSQAPHKSYKLTLRGLVGGHSGCDIHVGLGNANKLMARFLGQYADSLGLMLSHIEGGTLRNAIPRYANAEFTLATMNEKALYRACDNFLQLLQSEFADLEPNLVFELIEIPTLTQVLTTSTQTMLINWLNSMPNGVMRMSHAIPNVVEASLNIGVVQLEHDHIKVTCLVRSLVDSQKDYICDMLKAHCAMANAKIECTGDYPGWAPDHESELTRLVEETYHQLFNKPVHRMVIHAGLECGLFKKPYPSLDMVSIGPTIVGAHSPDERVNIPSVELYWQLLLALLKAVPVQ